MIKKVNYVGMKITNPIYGEYEIIEDLGMCYRAPSGRKIRKLRIRFTNTGYTTEVFATSAMQGGVKDPYARTIYGVGYLGEPEDFIYDRDYREYNIWNGMICRCYCETNHNYENYGAKGVTVSEEWQCFANFLRDFRNMPDYNRWKNEPDFELDKDYLQQGVPIENKIYSKETCRIVHKSYNSILMHQNRKMSTSVPQYVGVEYICNGKYRTSYSNNYANKNNGYIMRTVFDDPTSAAIYHDLYCKAYNTAAINNVPVDPVSVAKAISHRCTNKEYKQLYHLISKEE